ncbi:hypothetical protein U9M48_029781 [Paspalum notatum var. saurae]|uniref:Uncharacterized protein n=1 Tax=Paspalum notatum var. saurae TaxID=547442 RepID=A0AAQ3X317_PASNO
MAPPAMEMILGFLLLTANSTMAIFKSWGDAAATIFVILSYACLVLLFYCLRRFEMAPPGSATRDRARVGVWLTTTLLTAMFSWRVATIMPWPVSAGVCLMGGTAVIVGFYALFLAPTGGRTENQRLISNNPL